MIKLTLAHEFLQQNGGAERVLDSFHESFPEAEIVTFIHDPRKVPLSKSWKVHTSFLQYAPFVRDNHYLYLPFYPLILHTISIKHHDVLLSSSYAWMKSLKTNKFHVCYCHTPMRFLYDLEKDYLTFYAFPIIWFCKIIFPLLRYWDSHTYQPDVFIANSHHVADRIKKVYKKDSLVIPPPVDTRFFIPGNQTKKYFLVVSRLLEYKKIDIVISALKNSSSHLIIVGEGRDKQRLMNIAKNCTNIKFTGFVDDNGLRTLYQNARALIHPQLEDAGITCLESLSSGIPVIAFKGGGALETIKDGETGIFFNKQSSSSLKHALHNFDNIKFDPIKLRESALPYDKEIFKKRIKKIISHKYRKYQDQKFKNYLKTTNNILKTKGLYFHFKRIFDIIVSLSLLAIIGPLMVIIGIVIFLITKKSPLFQQERCGKHHKKFMMWKFRTLYSQNNRFRRIPPLSKVIVDNAPLISRLLRRTCLDELPQLWNILKGEMSFVGPRPFLPNEMSNISAWQELRFEVPPGLTGVWQISRRSELSFEAAMELDIEYVRKCSFFYDLLILIKTIPLIALNVNRW